MRHAPTSNKNATLAWPEEFTSSQVLIFLFFHTSVKSLTNDQDQDVDDPCRGAELVHERRRGHLKGQL